MSNMFRSQRKSHLSIELLESRENPAGAITASVANGTLTITGDDYDNIFAISRNETGLQIFGTDTLINGLASPATFGAVVNSIKVTTLGGADDVSIAPNGDFSLAGSATFDLGDGSNKLTLVTTGHLVLGTLAVKGGDGLDTVQVIGASGSQIGTSALFQYGIGGSNTTLKHLALPGAGQVTLAAADGADTFTMDDCQTKGVIFSGGYGQSSLIIKNSSVGAVTMNGSQGPASVSLVNSTAAGTVKAVGPEGIQVSLDAATVNGDVIANGGLYDLDSAVGLTVNNVVSVTGKVDVKGYNTTINLQPGSSLTAGFDIIWHATDAVTATGNVASLSARNLTATSPRSVTFAQNGNGSSLALTGELTANGRVVDLSLWNASVDKSVSVNGSAKASFTTKGGSLDQLVNVISSVGSATLLLGGIGTMDVGGNVYVSGKLTTSVGLAGNFKQNVTVNGGIKEDTFGLGTGTFSKNVSVNLKDGNNVVGIGNFAQPSPPEILGNLTITTGNGNDLVGFLCHVAGKTSLGTGGGTDTLWMYGSTFDGTVNIALGAGDDLMQIQDGPFFTIPVTFNAKTTIDAGAGNDKLILGLAPGDPNAGGGDANSMAVFAPGLGSSILGGSGINTFDDDAGQFSGVSLAADFSGWVDPT